MEREMPESSSEQDTQEPVPQDYILREETGRGEYKSTAYGLQDTFLTEESDPKTKKPPVPFRRGKRVKGVTGERIEKRHFAGRPTEEAEISARTQRYAIQKAMEKRNAPGK